MVIAANHSGFSFKSISIKYLTRGHTFMKVISPQTFYFFLYLLYGKGHESVTRFTLAKPQNEDDNKYGYVL